LTHGGVQLFGAHPVPSLKLSSLAESAVLVNAVLFDRRQGLHAFADRNAESAADDLRPKGARPGSLGSRGRSTGISIVFVETCVRPSVVGHGSRAAIPVKPAFALDRLRLEQLRLGGPPCPVDLLLHLVSAEVLDELLALDSVDERLAKVVMAHNVCDLAIGCTSLAMSGEALLVGHKAAWITAINVLEIYFGRGLLQRNLDVLLRQIFQFGIAIRVINTRAELRCAD